ncbi:uncharacterized protein [Cherax quadricarinatus]|uniref:uncharacterized protein n=1 Tax=Cherax quadricarinatus TaxID=27406 RepID=UPI00387EBDF9
MMLVVVTVVVVMGTFTLPHTQALDLWLDNNDYIDFAIMKSCLGVDLAMKLEKVTYEMGKSCQENVQNTIESSLQPLERVLPSRKKRAVLKLSEDASLDIIMCNLQGLNLVKSNLKVDYNLVPELIKTTDLQPEMKEDLTEGAEYCREQQEEIQKIFTQSNKVTPISGLLTGTGYVRCLILEALGVCKKHEQKHYASIIL